MTNIQRYYKRGQIYFLTHVIFNRQPLLIKNFKILWNSICSVQTDYPFENIAWVVLPDHFHILIDLKEHNLSGIIRKIKLSFSFKYKKANGLKRSRIWQNRFWDHIIRNEADMNRHIDYIHYNPVKHNLSIAPDEYGYSSFNKYKASSYYSDDWGRKEKLSFEGDFGE